MAILTTTNARAYCKRTQNKTRWYVYDLVAIPMTVLGLRNLNSYRIGNKPNWVLSWKRDANMKRAIELVFLFLKGWQAFRTSIPSRRKIRQLKERLPAILLRFQQEMKRARVFSIAEVDERRKARVVRAMARAVHQISKYKTEDNPMLASKILHFFFPEFFPVWDTYWIRNKCLRPLHKRGCYFLSEDLGEYIEDLNAAAHEYGRYVELMLKEIRRRPALRTIRSIFLRNGEFDHKAIHWHYHDLTPTLFEMCLLGRYC
jgi:hypothetical protein